MEGPHTDTAGALHEQPVAARARSALAENPTWYHTIELAPGVLTPGFVDWRGKVERILPADLRGLRALDVGTFDGFWAFEMAKRGAVVVAIDVARIDDAQWPPAYRDKLRAEAQAFDVELGRGFRLARECLGSSAQRVVCDVLDLTPEAIGGPVDIAFLGALLLHLRDPIRALENINRTLKPGGRLIAVEGVSLRDSLLHPRTSVARFNPGPFDWWLPNRRALLHFLWAAGFEQATSRGFLHPPAKPEMRGWYCMMEARASSAGVPA